MSMVSRGRKVSFLLSAALIIIVNVAVLTGVYANRGGDPEAEVVLTERELPLEFSTWNESSSMAMRLRWRVNYPKAQGVYSSWVSPEWFGETKLAELGFETDRYNPGVGKEASLPRPLPRRAYLVLEMDGAQYREVLTRVEQEERKARRKYELEPDNSRLQSLWEQNNANLEEERLSRSRLFVVDAGLDTVKLREKYPERDRYIIVKGVVRMFFWHGEQKKLAGQVERILNQKIHLPTEHHHLFEQLDGYRVYSSSARKPPRYKAQIAYGSRLEPYLVTLEKIEQSLL